MMTLPILKNVWSQHFSGLVFEEVFVLPVLVRSQDHVTKCRTQSNEANDYSRRKSWCVFLLILFNHCSGSLLDRTINERLHFGGAVLEVHFGKFVGLAQFAPKYCFYCMISSISSPATLMCIDLCGSIIWKLNEKCV